MNSIRAFVRRRVVDGLSRPADRIRSSRVCSTSAGPRLSVWLLALCFLFLFGTSSTVFGASPQSRGTTYLQNAIHKFDGIKDYVVDVRVHLDLKAVQMPDMEGKIYYKAPDKIKMDSKGFFLMPRDVGIINPQKFDPDKFEVAVIDTLSYKGEPAVKLSLVPKNDVTGNRNIVLTIDTKDWLILEIATAPYPGREASARITYGDFDGFKMPVKVDVKLDVGKMNGMERFGHQARRMSDFSGTVEIYYSNYKINSGLSDKLFEKKGGN